MEFKEVMEKVKKENRTHEEIWREFYNKDEINESPEKEEKIRDKLHEKL